MRWKVNIKGMCCTLLWSIVLAQFWQILFVHASQRLG